MTNIKQFPRKSQVDDLESKSELYDIHDIYCALGKMKHVTDFTTGGKRNRRWGMVLSFAVVPKYDETPATDFPTLLPKAPAKFLAADSIEDLRARAHAELDMAFTLAEMSVNDPDGLKKLLEEHSGTDGLAPVEPENDMN